MLEDHGSARRAPHNAEPPYPPTPLQSVAKSGLQLSTLMTKTIKFKGALGCILGIRGVLFGMQFSHPIHNGYKPPNRHHELRFAGYQITVFGGRLLTRTGPR